jgi:hypothetical protein
VVVADSLRGSISRPLPWALCLAVAAAAGLVIAVLPLDDVLTLTLAAGVVGLIAVLSAGRPRVLVTLGAFVYVGLLHWVYIDWVSPVYAYYGLINTGADWPVLTAITILAVLPAFWLPTELDRPSDVVLWFLYLFGYVPACAIPIHMLGPELWTVLPFSGLLAIAFSTLALTRRIRPATPSWSGMSERGFSRLLVVMGLASIAYVAVVFGIPTGLPDFESVYGARADYAAVATVTIGAGYIVPWAGNVIFPFLMAMGLARSRLRLLALGTVGELMIYGTAGFKSVLFAIVLVPTLYVIVTRGRRHLGSVLVWASVLVIGLSVVGTWVSGSLWPLALFVTRLIAVPGQMAAYYFDFFSSHETYLLSHSFLRLFIASPYDVDPPYLIGAVYLHSPTTDANADLWADAMANFGLIGIIPFTVVLGGVLWVLDSVSSGRDLRVITPLLGLVGITLGNGALFTTILTLGVGLTILLIALMPTVPDDPAASEAMPGGP